MIKSFREQASSNLRITLSMISLIILVTLSGCERAMTIEMDASNPPTFKLSGSGRLFFFSVFEVPQGRPSSIDDPKMWEIRPAEENLISRLPPITYGMIPKGFKQTIPNAGVPPALVEGKVYEAGGPALEADGGSIRFTIKDGRAVEVTQNKRWRTTKDLHSARFSRNNPRPRGIRSVNS